MLGTVSSRLQWQQRVAETRLNVASVINPSPFLAVPTCRRIPPPAISNPSSSTHSLAFCSHLSAAASLHLTHITRRPPSPCLSSWTPSSSVSSVRSQVLFSTLSAPADSSLDRPLHPRGCSGSASVQQELRSCRFQGIALLICCSYTVLIPIPRSRPLLPNSPSHHLCYAFLEANSSSDTVLDPTLVASNLARMSKFKVCCARGPMLER